jgi:CheY-like chemotaxis protein/HPt (histidine-containing phosphotransfer) domain-containing protein
MPPTILVVDDEPALRSFAEALLEDLGYSALLAENGRAAVQALLQDPDAVAAVLLDMTMPGLSPTETFRLMREIRPDLPVIILSGDLESTVREHFPAGTIAAFVQKPYTDVELETALTETLARHSSTSMPPPAFKLVRLSDDEVDGMRQDYLAACRLDLARLETMLAAQDFLALQVMGHTLKGSGGCFGLSNLTQLGNALETSAKASDAAGCGEQIDTLRGFLGLGARK